MIKFCCPHCAIILSAAPEQFGISLSCPSCGNAIVVPFQSEMRKTAKKNSSRLENFITKCGYGLIIVILASLGLIVFKHSKRSSTSLAEIAIIPERSSFDARLQSTSLSLDGDEVIVHDPRGERISISIKPIGNCLLRQIRG